MNFTIEVYEAPRRSDAVEHVIKIKWGSEEIQKVARLSGCAMSVLTPKDYATEASYQVMKKIREGLTDYFYERGKRELQTMVGGENDF